MKRQKILIEEKRQEFQGQVKEGEKEKRNIMSGTKEAGAWTAARGRGNMEIGSFRAEPGGTSASGGAVTQ